MNSFGRGIRKLREAGCRSLQEVAAQARIPWRTIEQIEAGSYFPRLSELERLLHALGIRFHDIQLAADYETLTWFQTDRVAEPPPR